MNLKPSVSLWLIRIYALIIALAALSGMLEGSAFKLVILLAVALIIAQSFFAGREMKAKETPDTSGETEVSA